MVPPILRAVGGGRHAANLLDDLVVLRVRLEVFADEAVVHYQTGILGEVLEFGKEAEGQLLGHWMEELRGNQAGLLGMAYLDVVSPSVVVGNMGVAIVRIAPRLVSRLDAHAVLDSWY